MHPQLRPALLELRACLPELEILLTDLLEGGVRQEVGLQNMLGVPLQPSVSGYALEALLQFGGLQLPSPESQVVGS